MALPPTLRAILACPIDRGQLWYFESLQVLYNPRLKKKYRVELGVPQLLVEEALAVDEREHLMLLNTAHD